MQPAAAALGAYLRETSAPAENKPMSALLKSKLASSPTGSWRLRKLTDLPIERLLASGYNSDTGKLRSSSTSIMASPTSPVAPTTATLNFRSLVITAPDLSKLG